MVQTDEGRLFVEEFVVDERSNKHSFTSVITTAVYIPPQAETGIAYDVLSWYECMFVDVHVHV